MTADHTSDIPQKRCTSCQQLFPATQEFFYTTRRGENKLRPLCKLCHNAKLKQFYAAHPDKKREITKRYCDKNPEKRRESVLRHFRNNRAAYKKRKDEWRKKNPEKVRAEVKRYREKYPEKIHARKKLWDKANPGRSRHHYQVRRNRKLALPTTFTMEDWQHVLEYFDHRCAYCGNQRGLWQTDLARDHFIPISKGGGYTPDNIIPACNGPDGCNTSKHDSDPHEWAIAKFGPRKGKQILKRIQDYFASLKSN